MINRGDKVRLADAEVISAKVKFGRFGEYIGVLVSDQQNGKVWFKTTAEFAYRLDRGDKVSATVECTGTGEDIVFAKKPVQVAIQKAVETPVYS